MWENWVLFYPNQKYWWQCWTNTKFDLLLWGSPCQWFSFAWKQLAFDDPRSKLFFEYVRILKEVKPKYFLLENVKMKKEFQDVISEYVFWIQPVIINSALLTAQNRVRLYWVWELQEDWTYKQIKIEQPEDKWILLKDILESEVDEKYNISEKQWEKLLNYESNSRLSPLDWKSYCLNTMQWWHRQPKIAYAPWSMEFKVQWWKENKSPTLCARDYKDPKVVMELNKEIPYTNFRQDNIFCWKDDKVPTLTAGDWGLRLKLYIPEATKKWFIEVESWDCFDFTQSNSKTRRWRLMKNKSNCMTAWNFEFMNFDWYRIRKLTPIECERLQWVRTDILLMFLILKDVRCYEMDGLYQ